MNHFFSLLAVLAFFLTIANLIHAADENDRLRNRMERMECELEMVAGLPELEEMLAREVER